jgi:CHAD domain-containing protein
MSGQNGASLRGEVSRVIGERERALALPIERRLVSDDPPAHGPVRLELVQLPPNMRASHCCSVMLAIHAAAIAQNVECVLTSIDAEGPHQLRVSLRRLRVVLRTFRPVMREAVVERLIASARKFGAIVSDLRDADVVIDELIGPAAGRGGASMMSELGCWRQEVRGRVRARLLAAGAPAFASDLAAMAGTFSWRKRNRWVKWRPATDLIADSVERCRERVAGTVARVTRLSHEEIHDLRKDVKALRYTVELANATSLNCDAKLAHTLKRVQGALGYVNDVALLERFSPPLVSEKEALARLRNRLVLDHADAVEANLASAAARLRDLAAPRCAPASREAV